jgi:predicted Na+-dependent transporter
LHFAAGSGQVSVMRRGLEWVGARARWVLAVGVLLAFLIPEASRLLRPILPALVAGILALAMMRIDMAAAAREAMRPRQIAGSLLLLAMLMPGMMVLLLWLHAILDLPEGDRAFLIAFCVAPPIASSGALALILRFDAARAVQITVIATLLTPIIGPATVAWLAPGALDIPAMDIAQRLATIIISAVVLALLLRRAMGPARIAQQARALDGIAALALLTFVIPLFDGVTSTIRANPGEAARVMLMVTLVNLGALFAVRALAGRFTAHATAGTLGLIWGNRNVALYFAALPYDPAFSLAVALYQIPMLATPLILSALPLARR